MSAETMLVYCIKCQGQFEMPKSNIKEIDIFKFPKLLQKYTCPFCGKSHKEYADPSINYSNAIDRNKDKTLEEQRRKRTQPITCSKCGSTQVQAINDGFSITKGIVGNLVLGDIGILAGINGKANIVCLSCGNRWKPGK